MEDDNLYKDVHNYTKFKLVEMLITRHQEGRLNLDNLNSIEDLVDDVLKTLAISGMKFYSELKWEFNENRD